MGKQNFIEVANLQKKFTNMQFLIKKDITTILLVKKEK